MSHDIKDWTELAAREIKELMLQAQLDEMGAGYAGSMLTCTYGGKFRFIGNRKRKLRKSCGDITLNRAYYYCKRCGESRAPLESASSIMERLAGISVSPKDAQLFQRGLGLR